MGDVDQDPEGGIRVRRGVADFDDRGGGGPYQRVLVVVDDLGPEQDAARDIVSQLLGTDVSVLVTLSDRPPPDGDLVLDLTGEDGSRSLAAMRDYLNSALSQHLKGGQASSDEQDVDADGVDEDAQRQADAVAARALVTIRTRTGRPIPDHVRELAAQAPAGSARRPARKHWWQR